MSKVSAANSASIFDIFTEDSLRGSLKPAWNYIIKILQKQYPKQMRTICNYSEESFYIVLFLLEEYSLRKNSSTITESFYALSRQSSAEKNSWLSSNVKWLSLASVVLLPYFVERLEKKYEDINEKHVISNASLNNFEICILKYYPIGKTLIKWIRIVNYMLYLFGKSNYPYPMLGLLRINLIYGPPKSLDELSDTGSKQHLLIRALRFLPDTAASVLSRMAPVIFYSLQFMDTFYQEDGMLTKALSSFKVSKPPESLVTKVVSSRLPNSKQICPLCHGKHCSPTTTSVSGFVFCYTCIFDYINQFKCCPITYRPCQIDDLIRIHVG